jgi:hypothetical protein
MFSRLGQVISIWLAIVAATAAGPAGSRARQMYLITAVDI